MQMRGCRSRNTWGDLKRGGAASCLGSPPRALPGWGSIGTGAETPHVSPKTPTRSSPGGLWAGLTPRVSSRHHPQPGQGPPVLDALEEPLPG